MTGRQNAYDANRVAERLRRQVLSELGSDHSRVAVRPRDLAPDDADF